LIGVTDRTFDGTKTTATRIATEQTMTATLYPSRTHRAGRIGGDERRVHPDIDYAARRARAGLGLVVAIALLALGSFAAVGPLLDDGRSASASDIAAAPVVRIHVAQPGDTMWSIAQRYRGDVGQDRFVDALIDVNGGTAIQIGQAIRLP
jgi:hypothetical protein